MSVEYVNVFQGVESLAALELIDIVIVIYVELVSTQNGHRGGLIK